MEDIVKSIKAYLYDRSTSPLFGAFITAWSIWNYRFFIILLSAQESSTDAIFNQINELFYSPEVSLLGLNFTINGTLYNGLLIPATITLLYIYLYPSLAKPVYEHSLKKRQQLRAIKHKEESNRLLSVEESRELYKRMADLQTEYSNDIDNYNKQIASLNQTIKELEKAHTQTHEPTGDADESLYDEINDAEPEEFDKSIEKAVSSLGDGEFQLSNLFNGDHWSSLNSTLKQKIGKRFKERVLIGAIAGVKHSRTGSGNQQIYTKLTSSLSPSEEKSLSLFAGLRSDHGLSESEIHKEIGGHIELVRMHLHDLLDQNFIKYFGESDTNEKLYSLEPKGRKYLIQHNLLTEYDPEI